MGSGAVDEQFHDRIDYCVQRLGGSIKASMVTGISKSTLNRWTHPNGPDVPASGIRALAEATQTSVDWIVTGRGSPNSEADGFQSVPLYDVRLAAGVAKISEAARVISRIPLDVDLLRQLGRPAVAGLAFVEAAGDSMEPTIPDGSRVLLDLTDTRLREGVFGFRFDDELRVKRLRRVAEGVEVISDNPRYQTERLEGEDLLRFAVIGRACWIGAIL